MSKHEWREHTSDGDVRYVSANRQAARWKFKARLKTEESWTPLDPMPLDDLEELREILWKKYQRRRVPHEQVLEIDAMISRAKERP